MRVTWMSVLLWSGLFLTALAFSPQDHEIFRLRDELASHEGNDVTFYDFLGITPSASQEDIQKAARKKSKSLHPDKVKQSMIAARAMQTNKAKIPGGKKPKVHVNKPPSESEIQKAVKQANAKYGRLRIVSTILQGEGRERYDFFLANGFPAWRGTGYYYARYRPGLGTVLMGLFLFGGGLVHYGAMYLGWKRQRDFVGRYIRHARRAAWGDESGIGGIPGVRLAGAEGAPPASALNSGAGGDDSARDNGQAVLNRRQKRAQEKEARKKEKSGKGGRIAEQEATPEADARPAAPFGAKKRVQAENGKILIVDSVGNVFLQEETEEGETEEFLLDPDEIPKPSWRDTVVVKLPVWAYEFARRKMGGKMAERYGNGVALGGGATTEGSKKSE